MNKLDRIKKINQALNFFNMAERSKVNCVRFNSRNIDKDKLDKHELFKARLGLEANKKGFTYLTEAKLKNNCRPDFVLLDIFWIIEILGTETVEECKEKIKNYPSEFTIKIIDSKKEFPKDLI